MKERTLPPRHQACAHPDPCIASEAWQAATGSARARRCRPFLLDDEEATAIVIALRTAAIGGITGIAETAVGALAKLEPWCADCPKRTVPMVLRRHRRRLSFSRSR